jgi:hypothetical protein
VKAQQAHNVAPARARTLGRARAERVRLDRATDQRKEDRMASREEGNRRIRNATVGLAAASLAGTVAVAVTVAVQANAATPAPTNGTTDNGTTQDQGGNGAFTPPDGSITNGGTGDLGGSTGSDSTGILPHARSGGSR